VARNKGSAKASGASAERRKRGRDTIRIRRTYTDGPLQRLHERAITRGSGRKIRPIPWGRFRSSAYSEAAALAIGEYTAVDQFARLASALALNGAPMDLVAAAAQVPADEIRHSDHALHFAGLCAGRELELAIPRPPYEKNFSKPVDQAKLDLLMVELPTIAETLTAALLEACMARATDPVAHALYAQIVSDEVHHLRLGWYYLAWRAPQWTRRELQRVADYAGERIQDVETTFWTGRDAPRRDKKAADALGVLDTKAQRAAIRRVMESEIVPGLDALGLGASHAWRARPRGRA
jgi:hypothetical protein